MYVRRNTFPLRSTSEFIYNVFSMCPSIWDTIHITMHWSTVGMGGREAQLVTTVKVEVIV